MTKELKKKVKNIKKITALIKKNSDFIKHVLVSELFLNQIIEVADFIDVKEVEDEDGTEMLFIFGKPINLSHFINDGCILVMQDDEYVVLKGI